jgi:hypothetical protein
MAEYFPSWFLTLCFSPTVEVYPHFASTVGEKKHAGDKIFTIIFTGMAFVKILN